MARRPIARLGCSPARSRSSEGSAYELTRTLPANVVRTRVFVRRLADAVARVHARAAGEVTARQHYAPRGAAGPGMLIEIEIEADALLGPAKGS